MTFFYAYAHRSIAKLHYYLKQCGSSHFLFLYIYIMEEQPCITKPAKLVEQRRQKLDNSLISSFFVYKF